MKILFLHAINNLKKYKWHGISKLAARCPRVGILDSQCNTNTSMGGGVANQLQMGPTAFPTLHNMQVNLL